MSRIHNFSSGPAMLPAEVLARAGDEMLDWHGCGMGVMEMSHRGKEFTGIAAEAERDLRELLGIPDGTFMAGTITVGKPAGRHGAVRRRPIAELVYEESWGDAPAWAIDPPGTQFTSAGPPKKPKLSE